MADDESTSVDITPDVSVDTTPDVSADEIKKRKKLKQLADARQSAKDKKRKRDSDIDDIKATLDTLTKTITAANNKVHINNKKEEEASDNNNNNELPQDALQQEETRDVPSGPSQTNKRQKITKDPEEEDVMVLNKQEEPEEEGWSTSLIRTSALVSLGIGSWYFQNVFGKKKPAAPTPQQPKQKKISQIPEQQQKAAPKTMLPLRMATRNTMRTVGKSGFSM